MFIGQYEHSLEEKGRLLIPKDFREKLEEGSVLTKGLDGCLFLYSKEKWSELVTKLETLPLTKAEARAFSRLLTYGAVESELDRVGRILIPQYLREYANLTNSVVVAGNLYKIEIWDREAFFKYQSEIEKNSEAIAEKLTELGI
jgi:MraZ protein